MQILLLHHCKKYVHDTWWAKQKVTLGEMVFTQLLWKVRGPTIMSSSKCVCATEVGLKSWRHTVWLHDWKAKLSSDLLACWLLRYNCLVYAFLLCRSFGCAAIWSNPFFLSLILCIHDLVYYKIIQIIFKNGNLIFLSKAVLIYVISTRWEAMAFNL